MNKKYIWLIEIIIWLIIISVSLFFFIYKTSIKNNVQNTYYIFVDDADGLVKGSPIRLMGINIGYVKDVKIFDNKVFLSFLVTKEGVQLPKCAVATIEFYGLGGSTSLELMPSNCTKGNEEEIIIPSGSYRVQDFWDGQKLTSNVMINIYGSIGRNIDKSGIMYKKDLLIQSKFIEEINKQLGKTNNSETVLIYKLSEKNIDLIKNKNNEEILEENNEFRDKEKNNE